MKGLKGKIIVIMLLASLLLGGLGYFSLTRLFELTDRISHLAEPTGKWRRFQRITTDLSKLNSIFVLQGIDADKSFDEDHLPLIDSIKVNIARLKVIYSDDEYFEGELKLDTIPVILDQIKDEFVQVNELRTRKQTEVYQNLEAELLQKLSEISIKDSLLVVEKISYEVRRRNVPDSIFVPQESSDEEKSNFLQRLFGKERSRENELVIQQKEVVEDTLVITQSDTMLLSSSEGLRDEEITEIIKNAFTNYYRGEIELMEKIRETEQNFYAKNARITNELEVLINDLRYQETLNARQEAARTYQFSRRFQGTIIAVIVFFFLCSIILVYFSLRDINKNRRYQSQIIQSEQKAKREAKAKQDFLSTMSHELRTPLTSIIGYANMLNPDDENAKAIKSSSQHLLMVANEILDTAKVEAGIIEINAEAFDLRALLLDVARSFQGLIQAKGLKPKFEIPEQAIWVESDPHRIRQVLYNLLHNALKFTEKGTIGMRCHVRNLDNGQLAITIDVHDTGLGIQKEQQAIIFDQYKQAGTHKSKMQGTGLGLGIVKKVVEMLNGSIVVNSRLGSGATFTLAITMPKSQKKHAAAVEHKSHFHRSLEGLNIYCIDDDKLIAKLYVNILSGAGAKVTSQTNPVKALEHLKEHHLDYHVVITDVKMPHLSGYELLHALNASSARPKVIIASTANVLLSESDKNELKAFDAKLSKPINSSLLIETILQQVSLKNGKSPQMQPNRHDVSQEQDAGMLTKASEAEYDYSDYESFAMGDESFLQEIISDLIGQNEIELSLAFEKLKLKEPEPLADLIHKMSSRFAQLKVSDKADAKRIELSLRAGEAVYDEAEILLTSWLRVHKAMQQDYQATGG